MNEKIDVEVKTLSPFKNFCMTIGELPTSYVETMSYYEMILWFIKYLSDTVIPTINNNANAVEEVQQMIMDLQDYVNQYFENIDIDQQINNKLDQMATDGTLTNLIKAYVDPIYTAYENQMNADYAYFRSGVWNEIYNQNAWIEIINNKVERAVDNAPIPVSSVSDMTDTTKIYVNVTNGYWYYYDGDSWEQGGIYQSSQNLDEFDGLLDAFKSNNIKGLLNFSIGNVSPSNGTVIANNQRIYTDITSFPFDVYIDTSTTTKSNLIFYNNDDSYLKGWEFSQNENKGCFIPANQKFRIACYYVTPPDPVPNIAGTDPKESVLYEGLSIYRYTDYRTMQFTKLLSESYPMNLAEIKYQFPLILGDFNAQNGISESAGSFRRITNWYIIKSELPIRIKSKVSASAYIWYYSDTSGTNPLSQGWKDIYNTDVVIPANQCFRFVVSYSSTYNEPLYNVYDNNIFKNLSLEYVIDDTPTTFENNNLHYIKSIAHQGYSNTGEINYCKLSGYQNAKNYGFDYGELDIRMTSDNVLVCSHDDTFTSNGVEFTISENTYSDLSQLDYHGGQLATFESIIALCKKIGLGVYIDHLYTLNATGWDSMFRIIKKYQMQDNVVFLCNTQQAQITRVLNFYYKSRIAIVTESTNIESIVSLINTNKTNFNEFSIDTKYSNYTPSDLASLILDLPVDVKVEVWTIDNINEYKAYLPYVSGITSNSYSILQVLSNE